MAIDRGKLKNDVRNYFDRIIELAEADSPDIVLILESARDGVMKIIGNQTPVTAGSMNVRKLSWAKMTDVRPIDANSLERDTEWDDRYDGFLSYSQSQIDAAPTLDYKPVRYAEWDENYRCTNCGISLRDLVAEDSDLDTDIILYGTPFCPNCGADMRE